MEKFTIQELPLPADQAFVLQFARVTDRSPPGGTGRVEHLITGQASHFASWAELRRFIEHVLADLHAKKEKDA
jgi:hypothetical protein